MDKLCRICLDSLEGKYNVSITDSFNGVRLFEYINTITNIVIQENDGLPSTMCCPCYRELEVVMGFRDKCEKSDIKLRELNKEKCNLNVIKYEFKQESDTDIDPADDNSNHKHISLNPASPLEYDNLNRPDSSSDKNELSCCKCNGVFKTLRNLHTHQKKNTCEALKLECDDCGEIFKSKCKIAVHWKQMHLLRKLICSRCKMNFKSFRAYNNHIKTKKTCCKIDNRLILIKGEGKCRVFHCKECSYTTKAVLSMIVHIRSHTDERPYKCPYCPKSFRQISTLKFHKDYKHEKALLPKEKCSVCGKIYTGKKQLKRHIAYSHKDPIIQCNICNKSFQRRYLEMHMARHSGHKNFTCEFCAGSFYTSCELLTHRRKVHTKEKGLHCKLCKYHTFRSKAFKRHVDRHSDGSLLCNICFIFLKDRKKLMKHQQMHVKGKIFQCQYCDLKYHTNKARQKHVSSKHRSLQAISKLNNVPVNKIKVKTELYLNKDLEK